MKQQPTSITTTNKHEIQQKLLNKKRQIEKEEKEEGKKEKRVFLRLIGKPQQKTFFQ